MIILNKSVSPSEGEVLVKSYLCTSFSSLLFGIKADGYLEVTSKRLLFQASGTGAAQHKSIIHSEVPISEVVGINIYKGKAFNILRLIGGFIVTSLISTIVLAVIGFSFSFLDNSPTAFQVIIWLLFIGALYLAYMNKDQDSNLDDGNTNKDVKDNSLKELAITAIGLGLLSILIKGSMGFYNQYGSGKVAIPVYLIILIYALYRYSKKPAFSLQIFSKSGTNAIVKIAGPSPMGSANSAASKALTAKPGVDSVLVLKELGAVIFDIQNLGEYGIEKWQKK